jgi:O-antigen/teichoic acid export membrane protein
VKTSVRRAGLTNTGFSILSSATNVVLVPAFLSIYELKIYGALSLLTALAQYFTILDFGFSNALVRYWIRTRSHGDLTYFQFRTSIVAYFAVAGLAVTAVGSVTSRFWGSALNLAHVEHLPLAAFAAGALTVITVIGNCYNSSLVGDLQFARLNTYNYIRNIGPQLTAALVFIPTQNLGTALACSALFSGLLLTAHVLVLRKREAGVCRNPVSDSPVRFGTFFRESIGFSAQSLVRAFVLPLLQAVIGARFGSEVNGALDIARRLLFAFRRAVESAFVPLFARANQLIETGHLKQLGTIALRGTILSVSIAFGFFIALRFSIPWILPIWIGQTAKTVEPIALTFLVGVTFTIPHIAAYQILSTSHRGRAINAIAGALVSAVLLIGLTRHIETVTQVLALYAVGVFLGAVLTLAYSARLIANLRSAGDKDSSITDVRSVVLSRTREHPERTNRER